MTAQQTQFLEILREHKRVGIVGGPRTGKTTLASLVRDRPVIGTDRFKDEVSWDDTPASIIAEAEKHESVVIEGVMVARALRKGLPLDAIIYLTRPKVDESELKQGHRSMAKGVQTVFREWRAGHLDVPVFVEQ
jgi:dephospho-CoA kinase